MSGFFGDPGCDKCESSWALFEGLGLSGEQLGNFPQAFSHLSLINAAINLDYQLDHGAGRVGVLDAAQT